MLNILACQIDIPATPDADARDTHIARLEAVLDDLLTHRPVDLVVLPELSTIDYSRDSFKLLSELAEELDGPTCSTMSRLARRHNIHVVFGMPRRLGNGRYRIAQVIIGPDGSAPQFYDKIHLAQYGASMEREYFEPGEHLCVFEIAGLRIAPIICYDIRIPELTRTLCLQHGVELILHCGAYYRDESFYSWHQFVVTRAMENQIWVLSLSRAGEHYGESMLCPPWLDASCREISFSTREEFQFIEIDQRRIVTARKHYPFLNDTRSDYSRLPVYDSQA